MTSSEFKNLFLPLQRRLYREAYKILCDSFEAEDAVQNLYLRLWEKRNELGTLVAPEAYCIKVLRNICIDRLRQKRDMDDSGTGFDEIPFDAPPDIERVETENCLRHFLASLPELHSRVVEMKMNGLDYEEIENLTGLSAVNVRVIVSRVRKKFREYYNK